MNKRFCAKRPVLTLIFVLCGIFCAKAQILVEAESFSAKGGWVVDQQFMDLMGSPYLLAHGMGSPVEDALTEIHVSKSGVYHVWVRTYNWTSPWTDKEGPGAFSIKVGDEKLNTVLGTKGNFYKIDCYDMVGYIAKSQVKQNEDGTYEVCPNEKSGETTRLGSFSAQQAMEIKNQIVEVSKKYIGVPYLWGGTTPRGFDCSGFTKYVYQSVGITINRTACAQLANTVIVAKEDLQPGDLVILSNTGGRGFASHTGIYLGNGKLIHSGSSKGVVIVDLNSSYFVQHFQCARRVVLSDVSLSASMPTVNTITGELGSGWRN